MEQEQRSRGTGQGTRWDALASKSSDDRNQPGQGPTDRRKVERIAVKDLLPGAIFIAEHFEAAGDRTRERNAEERQRSGITECISHSQVIIKDRKFIVLVVFGHHYICVPLFTYNGTGSRGRSDEDEHVSLHDHRHESSKYRIQSKWQPLMTCYMTHKAYLLALDATVRLTFPLSRPKNLPVEYLGNLDEESTLRLNELYRVVNGYVADPAEANRLTERLQDPSYRAAPQIPTINTTLANAAASPYSTNPQPAPASAPSAFTTFGQPAPFSSSTPSSSHPNLPAWPSTPTTSRYAPPQQWGNDSPFAGGNNTTRPPVNWTAFGKGRREGGGGGAAARTRDPDPETGEDTSRESDDQDLPDATAAAAPPSSDTWDTPDPWKSTTTPRGNRGRGGGGPGGRALKRVMRPWKPSLQHMREMLASSKEVAEPVLASTRDDGETGRKRKAAAEGEERVEVEEGKEEAQHESSSGSSRRSGRKRTKVQRYAE